MHATFLICVNWNGLWSFKHIWRNKIFSKELSYYVTVNRNLEIRINDEFCDLVSKNVTLRIFISHQLFIIFRAFILWDGRKEERNLKFGIIIRIIDSMPISINSYKWDRQYWRHAVLWSGSPTESVRDQLIFSEFIGPKGIDKFLNSIIDIKSIQ